MPDQKPPDEIGTPPRALRAPSRSAGERGSERELHQLRDRSLFMERALHAGSWIWNPRSGAISWSQGFYDLLGISPHQERPSYEALIKAVHFEDKTYFLLRLEQSLERSEPLTIDHRILRRDGQVRYLHTEIACRRCGTRAEEWIGVMTDRAAGHRTWEHTHLIVDAIPDLFWVGTLDFDQTLFVSRAYENLWGRLRDDLQRNPRDFISSIVAEDLPSLGNALSSRAKGSAYEVHYRIRHPNGMVRWIRDRGYPLRNEEGKIWAMAGVAADVTDQRQQELELRESMRQAQQRQREELQRTQAQLHANQRHAIEIERLHALDTIAAGLAHELDNPLMAVMNDIDDVRQLSQAPEAAAVLEHASHELERMRALLRNILAFAERSVEAPTKIAVESVIDNALQFMAPEWEALGVQVRVEIDPSLPPLRANARQLQAVVVDLLMNARDAVERRGERQIAIHARRENEARIAIDVEDSGSGIPTQNRAQIFEPFFTTKPPGRGTGLSLSTARALMRNQEGDLILQESSRWGGARFTLLLPAVSGT